MLLDMVASVLFAKSIRDMAEERMRTHISLDIAMMSIDLRIALTRLSVTENELAHHKSVADSLWHALYGSEVDISMEDVCADTEDTIAVEDAIAMEDIAPKKDASLPYDYAREERNHFDALDYRGEPDWRDEPEFGDAPDYRDALDLGDPFPEMACL